MSLDEFFDAAYIPEPNSGCWIWLRGMAQRGYGVLGARPELAHRFSYEKFKGPIPSGLCIDHRCSNRACVNPDHLDAVTQGENIRRSKLVGRWSRAHITHCPQGHEYTPENTFFTGKYKNARVCRECGRTRVINRRAQSK